MKRDHRAMTCEGTRDELIAELEDTAEGWRHFAKDANASDCEQGIALLREGTESVRVGHTEYRVT